MLRFFSSFASYEYTFSWKHFAPLFLYDWKLKALLMVITVFGIWVLLDLKKFSGGYTS